MLSEEERRDCEKELAHHPRRQSVCVEALKVLQKHRGWVSDRGIEDLAEILGMSSEELDAVATFYNFIYRRAVGRHVIAVCDSVSCYATGSMDILKHLEAALRIRPGGTTEDSRFTLLAVSCLGFCEQAPAVLIDADVHGNLTPEKLDDILSRYK
jgi:NADH-quinone oxidoreductase subunit E